jgi:RecB family exonuclease
MEEKIITWSYSKLKDFKQCPRLAKFKYIDKIETPTSKALEHGVYMHEVIESYIRGSDVGMPELYHGVSYFRDYITELKKKNNAWFNGVKDTVVFIEETYAFTKDWLPTGAFQKDVWLRCKIDCIVVDFKRKTIEVIDWKTGKYNARNTATYVEQLKLYSLAVALNIPTILQYAKDFHGIEPVEFKEVNAKLCYVETSQTYGVTFPLKDVEAAKAYWWAGALDMTTTSDFPPKPSILCNYCHYSLTNKDLVLRRNKICDGK